MLQRSLLALSLLLATSASAEPHRYRRAQNVVIDTKQSGRVQPRRLARSVPAPSVTASQAMAIELAKQPLRAEQERNLIELVAATPDDDPDKPELLFRLAEHYAQQRRFWLLKAIEAELHANQ